MNGFPALSFHPRLWISRSAFYFSYPLLEKNEVLKGIFAINVMAKSERHSEFFVRRGSNACKQLTSLIVPRVSCLRPWERQNFPEPLKLEQTLSHR